ELIVTDVKYLLSRNPLRPAYLRHSADRSLGGDLNDRTKWLPNRDSDGRASPAPQAPSDTRHRAAAHSRQPLRWIDFPVGLYNVGHAGADFCYDNESPRHREYLEPFRLASRLVTNAEYLEFIADGGYERVELWVSDGWAEAERQEWHAPLYWEHSDGEW